MDTTPTTQPPSGGAFQGAKRSVAMALLAIGLLVVGGSAVAFAADPSPSESPTAATAPTIGDEGATTAPDAAPGTDSSGQPRPGRGAHGDCPADAAGGSDGGSSSDGGTTPTPNATAVPVPSLDPSDV
jgi:hypothetical protein